MRERAQRMVREARAREPGLSVNGACKRIGPQLGILPDTLPGWCKQTSIDRRDTRDHDRGREADPGAGAGEPRAAAGERDSADGVGVFAAAELDRRLR